MSVLIAIQGVYHGGNFATKSVSLWQMYHYKYVTMLQQEPFTWCPYKSYVLIDRYVTIENRGNLNHFRVNADLIKLTKADATYNKSHAKKYKGTTKAKIRKIYKYCKNTKYVAHVKYAKDVFQDRQGDCAGIASAFYVMCKKNHIPVRYVIGWTKDKCHAWNRVKIGKTWYWIDATQGLWLSKKQFKGRTVMEIW